MIIQVCVGSSCHLKGSADIVELTQQAIEKNHLETEITLAGSFCTGQCHRIGVTLTVDDEIFPGITRDTFHQFFQDHVIKKLKEEGSI